MRQFIKRILYCFIFFFTFLLLMYIIDYHDFIVLITKF